MAIIHEPEGKWKPADQPSVSSTRVKKLKTSFPLMPRGKPLIQGVE
jgi:hypothetical protein